MDVICFAPVNEQLKWITTTLLSTLPESDTIEIFRTVQSLSKRLLQPKKLDSIVVICTGSGQDLDNLTGMKDLFINTKTILILADRNNKAVLKAHTLNPRLILSADQDLSPIADVFNKIRSNFYSEDKKIKKQGHVN